MTDRDERGRLLPGHKGSNQFTRAKQEQSDTPTQPAEPLPENPDDFDAALLYVARNYGRGKLPKVGMIGIAVDLREGKPVDFAQLLSKASGRKAETFGPSGGGPGIQLFIDSIPSGEFVDRNSQIDADAKANWERRNRMTLTGEPPPPSTKPTLIHPRTDHDDDDEPSHDDESSLPANEVSFGESDDDDNDKPSPPDRGGQDRGGIDMNELWRRSSRKPRDGW